MKKKQKTKGFKWTGFLSPQVSYTPFEYVIYKGNLLREIVLPNRLKIISFDVLRRRVYDYLQEHQGRHPERIRVNRRQYEEYKMLFIGQVYCINYPDKLEYMGIPLIIHEPK